MHVVTMVEVLSDHDSSSVQLILAIGLKNVVCLLGNWCRVKHTKLSIEIS